MKGFNKNSIITAVVVSLVFGLAGPIAALAATAPSLGAAASFSVLGAANMTSAGNTTISGDLGLSPGIASLLTGTWTHTGGANYFGTGGLSASAQTAALGAFNTLAGETTSGGWGTNPWSPAPGVWTDASSPAFTGTITLNGNASDVWVFQISTDFTFSGNVVLAGNAQACNVFWQVARDATIGSGSHFVGTLIASRDITSASGATINGRLISLTGTTVAMNGSDSSITGPTCAPTTGTLHVVKTVIGGTATPSNFTLYVKNSGGAVVTSTPGVSGSGASFMLPTGTYTISEDANSSYTQSFLAGDCSGGSVTLSAGDNKICTIINTNIPVIPPAGVSVSTGGGRIVPLIGIVKVPTPLALSAGPGSVTYNYTVWNVGGQQALDNVAVTDDKCGPVTYVSGDLNGNGKLDPHEDWKYTCTTTLAVTTTNTATAIGYSDDAFHQPAFATAVAAVVVGAPITPPIINIVKVPSRLTPFPYGGGNVTYVYTVTNPGVVAMSNVSVTDDKCNSVSYVSGDTNGNNLLEPGEVWTYTCQTNVPVSSVNVATAKGIANGFTAVDYAFATVLVAAPGLPNTGFSPRGNSIPWNVIVLIGGGMLAAAFLVVIQKKRKI